MLPNPPENEPNDYAELPVSDAARTGANPEDGAEEVDSELENEAREEAELNAATETPADADVWADFVSPKAEADRKLIQAAKDGDEKAYERLMKKYQKSVYYLALKMVRNDEDAEDLTQESFAKAFASLNSFDPKFAFSTWLFRIATNSCIDYIRRKKLMTMSLDTGTKTEDGGNMVMQIEDHGRTPYEQYLRSQRHEYLNIALGRLPERYKKLVELRYYKEYSYEEVAEELNLPLGTVKAQLHRARELLNQELSAMEQNL